MASDRGITAIFIMPDDAPWGYYTCFRCGLTAARGVDPTEALAEELERFGSNSPDAVEVCDDCDKELMAWYTSLTPQERAEIDAS